MRGHSLPRAIKAVIGLSLIALVFVAPRSLAEVLLNPIIGTVDGLSPSTTESPTSEPAISPSPSPSPKVDPTPSPSSSATPSTSAPVVHTSDSASATASPSSPPPPRATASQAIHLEVPSTISVDPRAHSIFLPRIHASGAESLLICGHTNARSVNMARIDPGVAATGNGSSDFRISGPTNLAMASFNGEMGARLVSDIKAVSSSYLSLAFISLDKPSIDPALCNDGNASNTRTISFRAMNVDLNMVKDGVRLK